MLHDPVPQAGAVSRRDNVLAALVATLWGLNFLAIDLGMGDVPPLVFLELRFVAVVLPAVFLVPRPQVSWRVLAAVGLGALTASLARDASLPGATAATPGRSPSRAQRACAAGLR